MQKNNKKRKIIIAVTSILLIIAIAILVSTVVRNSISVNEENYETANGSAGSSYLLPEYIKAGVTIGGVTGTLEDLDTSDATATAADIALGKTAYVKGVKITGTYVSIPDLNSSNTTFRQNINYWTNQNVTVSVSTTVSGYTLQLAAGDPNVESNWHNATSQLMTENGTVYARLSDSTRSGGWTSYEVTNIDKEKPYHPVQNTTIGGVYGTTIGNISIINYSVKDIKDDDSGIAKVIFYYKQSTDNSYSSTEYNYVQINGSECGEKSYSNSFQANLNSSTQNSPLSAYIEVYDVAGNIAKMPMGYLYDNRQYSLDTFYVEQDENKPMITDFSINGQTLNFTAESQNSNINGYAVTYNTTQPTNFNTIPTGSSTTLSLTLTGTTNPSGYYYIWLRDMNGNISCNIIHFK